MGGRGSSLSPKKNTKNKLSKKFRIKKQSYFPRVWIVAWDILMFIVYVKGVNTEILTSDGLQLPQSMNANKALKMYKTKQSLGSELTAFYDYWKKSSVKDFAGKAGIEMILENFEAIYIH